MGHLACSLHRNGNRRIRVEWNMSDIIDHSPESRGHAFPYGRPEDGNVWEHFFEPVSKTSGRTLREKKTTAFPDPTLTSNFAHYLYKAGGSWRRKYNALYKKYIRIKPHIQTRVNELYSTHMAGKYVAGVQVRNDAHKTECINGEAVPFDTYVERVRNILSPETGRALFFSPQMSRKSWRNSGLCLTTGYSFSRE